MANPNAAASGGTGLVAVGIVWFLGNVWPHAAISAELAAGIATAASTVVLFFGRNGLAGVWAKIKHGSGS